MSTSRIFISYSHRGNGPAWKAALLRALEVFERQHLLDVWEDGKIRVSSYWEDDIEKAMDGAQVAVVILTQEALESEFILDKELPRLRDRQRDDGLPVFPVICEACDWRAHDWLRATQAPNASNPLSELKPEAQEHAFRLLATAIAEEISRVALHSLSLSAAVRGKSDSQTYLDKFPLTRSPGLREEKLIGREQELALLDLAFSQPHTAIVSLVAWGGVGKTMLVQHWLQRLQREGWFGAGRVYAWSFYSQGTQEDRQASEDLFLAHALAWFGVQCEPTLSPWDKGRLLAEAVARERTLLLLDGIEPLQYPPGPMGGQLRAPGVQALLKHLARKANAAQSHISNRPSAIPNCLCLVTTREPLTDLADFQRREGSPWGSVLRVDLGNLTDEAGAALLHHAGAKRAGAAEIKTDDKELLAASREVDGHALTLNLLGRFLARAHSGDIRRRDLVKFEEADRREQGGTTFKMLAAFENWFDRSGGHYQQSLAILRILGLFDRPADAGCIGALRKPPAIAGLTKPLFRSKSQFFGIPIGALPVSEEDWNNAVSFLSDFSLIAIQENNETSLLDCHPLIREYFAAQFRSFNLRGWQNGHWRLYSHLYRTAPRCTRRSRKDLLDLTLSKGVSEYPKPSLNDLVPLYQAIGHGCQAGLHQEALQKVFRDRILGASGQDGNYGGIDHGAFDLALSALANFFQTPWQQVNQRLNKWDQNWVLSAAGWWLACRGRCSEATIPSRSVLEFNESRKKDWTGASVAAANLSDIEVAVGDLSSAARHAEISIAYAERAGALYFLAAGSPSIIHSHYASILFQSGRNIEAQEHFQKAVEIQARNQIHPILRGVPGFKYNEFRLNQTELAAWRVSCGGNLVVPEQLVDYTSAIDVAMEHSKMIISGSEWEILHDALANLSLGCAGLYRHVLNGHNSGALISECTHVNLAVSGLQRTQRMQHVPSGLLTRAWIRFLASNSDGARADLDEAWDIASRGPMRLHLADIHLYRARLFFREENYPWESPQTDLAAAEKLINDCGYHRRDEELADAKRAILGT